jgi:hypothetical protein
LPYGAHCLAPHPRMPAMKLVIIAFLVIIVGSLGSALFYLMRDKGGSDRTVKALTIRVGLSLTLFLLLMLGYYFGFIPGSRQ